MFVWKVLQKTRFCRSRNCTISGWNLFRFSGVLGLVFMAFGALDAGLNFSDFHGCSWGGGTSKASSRVVMISLPNAGSKQASPPPSSEKRNGGHLISDTGDPSQPVAPLTRGRQICFDYHDNTKKYYELP